MSQSRLVRPLTPLIPLFLSVNEENEEINEPNVSQNEEPRMGVVSYDSEDTGNIFAREDVPFEKIVGEISDRKTNTVNQSSTKKSGGDVRTGVPKLGGKDKAWKKGCRRLMRRT